MPLSSNQRQQIKLKPNDVFYNSLKLFGIVTPLGECKHHTMANTSLPSDFTLIQPKRIVLHDITGHDMLTSRGYEGDVCFYINKKKYLGRRSIYIEFPKTNVIETILSYWENGWFIQAESCISLDEIYKRWRPIDSETGNYFTF